MEPSELAQILNAHRLWLNSNGKKGQQANFTKAILKDANLKEAQLAQAVFKHANLENAILQNADLRNADLEEALYVQTAQLAGANVGGAKLPPAIAKFDGLKWIAEATSNAQKLFIAMLAACLYSWLTIETTKDAALLTNSSSSPLPIIGTALPIVGFYWVTPIILVALYFYFHLNMQRLWEALADLPAVFPDGRPLDKTADPWLLNGLVRAHFFRLRRERPPFSRMQQCLSVLLAWWVVPFTLFFFWGRYLMRHDWFVTTLHVVLLTVAIGFGWMFYSPASATLRGTSRIPSFIWAYAWKDSRTYKQIAVCAFGVIFWFISPNAIQGIPRYFYSGEYRWWREGSKGPDPTVGAYSLRRLVPRSLEYIGMSPFAKLSGENLSSKPPNWTGDIKEYASVKGAYIRGANMEYADGHRAFLVNADMSRARLSNSDLAYADLSNADLSYANLTNADLSIAKLSNADLSNADLTNADLSGANLSGANLSGANLSGTNLSGANLLEANVSTSQLNKAKTDEHTLLTPELSP